MSDDAQPTRVIVRSMLEFMLGAVQAYSRPLGGDLLDTVVFATIHTSNLSLLAHNAAAARELFEAMDGLTDDQLRPVSINAVAKSFAIPYETARGAANRLIARGYCAKTPRGFIAPAAALMRPEFGAAEREVSRVLGETLARLIGIGFDFDQIAAVGGMAPSADTRLVPPPSMRHVSWLATEFMLRTVEGSSPLFGDFTAGFVFAGVMTANTRGFTYDPKQAWAYAGINTPPPNAMRKPVSVRRLSEQLNLPFETVRRHVNRLVKDGFLLRLHDGVIAPTEVMQDQRLLGRSPVVAMRFMRLIADLKRAGYVFAQPADGVGPEVQAARRG